MARLQSGTVLPDLLPGAILLSENLETGIYNLVRQNLIGLCSARTSLIQKPPLLTIITNRSVHNLSPTMRSYRLRRSISDLRLNGRTSNSPTKKPSWKRHAATLSSIPPSWWRNWMTLVTRSRIPTKLWRTCSSTWRNKVMLDQQCKANYFEPSTKYGFNILGQISYQGCNKLFWNSIGARFRVLKEIIEYDLTNLSFLKGVEE